MYQATYEIVTIILGYLFAFIISIIVYRLLRITLKDLNMSRKIKNNGKTSIGWLEVIEPEDDELYAGKVFALRRYNEIGRDPNCNIRLKLKGVKKSHAIIEQEGHSIILSKVNSACKVFVNGEKIRKKAEIFDEDEIAIGECLLGFYLKDDDEQEGD